MKILNEATRSAEEKVDLWEQGVRKVNVKACSDDKLKKYFDIADKKQYGNIRDILDNEMISRKIDMPKLPTVNLDLFDYEVVEAETSDGQIMTAIEDVGYNEKIKSSNIVGMLELDMRYINFNKMFSILRSRGLERVTVAKVLSCPDPEYPFRYLAHVFTGAVRSISNRDLPLAVYIGHQDKVGYTAAMIYGTPAAINTILNEVGLNIKPFLQNKHVKFNIFDSNDMYNIIAVRNDKDFHKVIDNLKG